MNSLHGKKMVSDQGVLNRSLLPGSCTNRTLSYAPIAGFPLRSNKALKGEAIVCYCESLITQQMKASDSCKIQGLITDVQYLYQFLIFKCHVVFKIVHGMIYQFLETRQ